MTKPIPKRRKADIAHVAGTIEIIGNPETFLKETRAEQAALTQAKMERLRRALDDDEQR